MKGTKRIIKQYYLYAITMFVIVLPWFFEPGYLFFTDFAWGPEIKINWKAGSIVYNLLFKLFSLATPLDFLQKIYIGGVFLLVLLGAKKVIEYFIRNDSLIFVISLFSLFNPFIYDRIMYGQFGVVAAFGFLCFALGYLLRYFEGQESKQVVLFLICVTLMFQFSPHFMFFAGLFVAMLFIIFLTRNTLNFKKAFKDFLWIIPIVIILNLNLFFGMTALKQGFSAYTNANISWQDLSAFQTSGKTGWEALKNVVMMSGFWGKDQFRYVDLTKVKEGWGRSFFALLPLILLGAYESLKSVKSKVHLPAVATALQAGKVESRKFIKLKVEEKDTRYKIQDTKKFQISNFKFQMAAGLIFLYIISIVLAVGIRLPVCRQITYWLFNYLPFYKGMREAQKWVAVIVVIYLIFLAMGAKRLFKFKLVEDNKAIVSILLAGVIIMQAPLMLWGLGGQVRPTQYPQDWYEIDKFIKLESYKVENKRCDGKILFLPWHMYMGLSWIGNVVSNPAQKFFICPVIQGSNMEWRGIYDNSLSTESVAIDRWIFSIGKEALPEYLNIKYIILAKEVDWKKYSWLDQIEDLVLIKETETLRLYEAKANNQ